MSAVMTGMQLARGSAGGERRRIADRTLYVALALLVLAAWWLSTRGWFKPGDEFGYWLGVAGGVMMLLLFAYPLRKYLRITHRWGKVKWWFIGHMVLGIAGPWLILVHSTFHLRSLNATIAMASMLVVAGSGVVGRFLYLRIHRDLQGRKDNLAELQRKAGLAQGEMRSRFRFAPEVAERLLAFETAALSASNGWATTLKRVTILPWQERRVYRRCRSELTTRVRAVAVERGWDRGQAWRRRRQALRLTRHYLQAVVRVAQFSAYERLFAAWHVLHVPFVFLLVITAGFHIFAVHAY